MIYRILSIILVLMLGAIGAFAQKAKSNTDRVMVLPFENTSKKGEFNWIGESLADSLTGLLVVPSLKVVSNKERKIIQSRLKMPLSVLPSLAASIKLARESKATILISGKYSITPEKDDVAASVTVKAKVIKVNEGRFLVEEFKDGSRKTREINLTDALGNLQSIQGQIAYQILYQRDSQTLPFTLNEFIEKANKIPSRAFEAYIKGMLTPTSDPDTRGNFFKNAMRIYAETRGEQVYVDAALEIGHLYLANEKFQNAIAYFARIPVDKDSTQYAEAAFYTGLIQWRLKRYEQALGVLRPLAVDLKLTSVYSTLGAIAVQASRSEKKNKGKSDALLIEGLEFLEQASDSTTDETDVFFNHGFALFLRESYKDAADKLRPVLAHNPRDGEAYFLLAKTLEKLNDDSAKDFDNQARRFLTVNNRYATLENKWKRGDFGGLNLRVKQPSRREFVSVVLVNSESTLVPQKAVDETAKLLKEAQAHYDGGRNDAAMSILRRIISMEPMSAETYLLLGKIYLRRGSIEEAIDAFKTSYFWNNRLIEAHVLLGRIYIKKRDCLQAKTYSVSALNIDSENEGALALERQVERCSK